jgi:salicylate hydroxylase
MRVIIAGGGIGGMALAAALGRRGMRSIVVEQAEAMGEVGAGLQLSPNAMRGLAALGLEDAVRAVGFAPEAVEMRDHASGRLLLRNILGAEAERRWGAPYLTVRRADLHRLLTEAARPHAEFRLSAKIVAVEDGGVRLASGERIEGEAVVGCDGVRSTVRQALFGEGEARFTGQVAWRFVVPIEAPPPSIVRVWTGPRQHFVCYPTRSGALMNVVAVTEETNWRVESWSEPGDKAVLRTAFEGWPAEALALIEGAVDLHRWALHDRPPLPRWSKGAATLLGDAAHPMLPFLAQGAAMAIEDAVVLADKLSDTSDTPEALRRYERARAQRTAKVQTWSRRNARLFHLPSPLAAGVFGAAAALDAFTPGGAARRFDWLYGYDATGGGG